MRTTNTKAYLISRILTYLLSFTYSWYVTSSGSALYSTLTKVNPGDVLLGTMTLIGSSVRSAHPFFEDELLNFCSLSLSIT